MEAPSFVSKARTAFHSAAAKAERVFTDMKSDFIADLSEEFDKQTPKELEEENFKDDNESKSNDEGKHLRWRPGNIGKKKEWQDRFKNIRIGKKGTENHKEKVEDSTMAVSLYDENLYILKMKNNAEVKSSQASAILERLNTTNPNNIPPSSAVKHLAAAIDGGMKFKSVKDVLAPSGGSSPITERASLSLATVKSLVLRDKTDKILSEFSNDENVFLLIQSLFDAEGNFLRRNIGSGMEAFSLHREIHGAPPESLLGKIAEVIGSFKTLQKMTLLWFKIVAELRRLWSEGQHIPGIPLDEIPDLNCCLLYQKFQVINCCISRKMRHSLANESLELVMRGASSYSEESNASKGMAASGHALYARVNSGELVLRLGTKCPADNLTMLETGEPIYFPVTQEGPLLTEDLIKETEELVLRTGSVGAGCSQLLSDMQAFKAANPGCILEDFVRWHSPPDWTESGSGDEGTASSNGGDSSSSRGQLSRRMQKEGNLWLELWETSKPVPAVKQAPLFDEDLVVEGILDDLEDMSPSELFGQLLIILIGLGFIMAEAKLSSNNDFSKLFYECKDYTVVTCQGSAWKEKVDDIYQVYETVEAVFLNPEEVLKSAKQTEETTRIVGETKRRFRGLGLNFGSKERNHKNSLCKDEKSSENSSHQPFSNFFDGKSSLFSKKPPRPESPSPGDNPPSLDDGDWTLV